MVGVPLLTDTSRMKLKLWQALSLLWWSLLWVCVVPIISEEDRQEERQVLVNFFRHNRSPTELQTHGGWLSETKDHCEWEGVTCHFGQVVGIQLSRQGLRGTLFSDLSKLPKLRRLELAENTVGGSLPAAWTQLTDLEYLDLSYNNFFGGFLHVTTHWPKIKTLELRSTRVFGKFPANMSTSLEQLSLGDNEMMGTLPTTICNLQNLTYLALNDQTSKLHGTIPSCIGKLTRLGTLNLGANLFQGKIPTTMGRLEQLTDLNLAENSFTGQFPTDLLRLSHLRLLLMGSNFLSGPITRGIAPDLQWSNLKSIKMIGMQNNYFASTIPLELVQGTKKTLEVYVAIDPLVAGSAGGFSHVATGSICRTIR